jgi:hypothetical protein
MYSKKLYRGNGTEFLVLKGGGGGERGGKNNKNSVQKEGWGRGVGRGGGEVTSHVHKRW